MTVRRTFTEMVEAGEPLMQQALQAIRDAKAVDPSGSSATGGWGCLKHLNERSRWLTGVHKLNVNDGLGWPAASIGAKNLAGANRLVAAILQSSLPSQGSPMLKRHRETLETRLEQVQTWGWCEITWGELYLWYAAERLSVKTYKHMLETYRELQEDESANLLATTVSGGIILTSPSKTSHLTDIINFGYDNAPSIS
ncbi:MULTISPECIES: hypothetical protein [Pseudomonas]|uniref:hypothetical protein n=2 Tax=Pseudomonas TaxID=286 RepID=UPI000C23414C|nr:MULTISPECIES: hypothetical protein [Pseudomonas]MBJ2223190.1 hypothetical protein [Pseudomonas sp. MF7451]MBW9241267.1 hypothetical protein [Pseudomonas carnis]PJI75522.1 hypothetical protein CSW00_03350 [Pseudomonas sp. MR 02]